MALYVCMYVRMYVCVYATMYVKLLDQSMYVHLLFVNYRHDGAWHNLRWLRMKNEAVMSSLSCLHMSYHPYILWLHRDDTALINPQSSTLYSPPPHCVHTHTNSPDNNTHAGKSQTTPLGWANPFISPSTFFANEYHYPGLATAYSLCTVGLDWIINRIVSHRNETHSPPPHTGGKIPPTRYHLWCEIPTTVNSFAGQLPSGFQWLAEKSPCQYSQLRLSHPFQNLATSMLNIPSVI